MKTARFLTSNILTLTITHFLWGFVNSVYMIQIQPYLLTIYGTTPETAQILGLILSIGALSAVLPLLLSFCADFYGRRKFIIFGEIASIVGLIGLSTAGSVVLVSVISIIIFNVGIGLYDPPLQGLIHESAVERRGLAYSIVYNSASLAGIIASFLIQLVGEIIIFFQMSCFLLSGAILINFLALRDVLPNNKEITFLGLFKKPLSRLTAIAFFIDTFSWGLPLSIANGIYIILFGVDVTFIATITFVETLFLVLVQYPAGMIVDRFGRILGLILGELTGIMWIGLVILAVVIPNVALDMLILAYAILGISIAFWRPSVTLSFIDIDPSAASTNFGILSFIQRLGYVPTAAISGFLFPIIGFSPLLIMTFIGTLIVISIFLRIDKIEKRLNVEVVQ